MDGMVIFPVVASLGGVSSAPPLPSEHRVGPAGPGAGGFLAGSLGAAAVLARTHSGTSPWGAQVSLCNALDTHGAHRACARPDAFTQACPPCLLS